MKVIATYVCLNCGAKQSIEHDVEEKKIFRRKEKPSIINVKWDWYNLSWEQSFEGFESKIGVNTENKGLLKLDPFIGHSCKEGENSFGIMQLVCVCNGDKPSSK